MGDFSFSRKPVLPPKSPQRRINETFEEVDKGQDIPWGERRDERIYLNDKTRDFKINKVT